MGGGGQREIGMHSHCLVSPYPCIRATNPSKLTKKELGSSLQQRQLPTRDMRVLDASDLSFPWHESIPDVLTLSSPKPLCFHGTSAGFTPRLPISWQRTDQCMEWMCPARHHSDNATRTVQWHMQLCLWSRSLQ